MYTVHRKLSGQEFSTAVYTAVSAGRLQGCVSIDIYPGYPGTKPVCVGHTGVGTRVLQSVYTPLPV